MANVFEISTIIYAVILFSLFLLFVVFLGAILIKAIRNVYRSLKAEAQYTQHYEEVNQKLDRVIELLENK
jgi:predicted PurR-regulated permease PerM